MAPNTSDLERLRIQRDDPRGTESARPAKTAGRGRGLLIALLGAAGIIVGVLGGMAVYSKRAPEVALAQVQVTGGASAASGAISANGYVVARTKASVSAKTAGRLASLTVSEGSYVHRGDGRP